MMDTESVVDKIPKQSSWTERGVARNPLSDARGEAASLHAHEGMVGCEPRHQVCGPNDAYGVAQNPLSDARKDDELSLDAKSGMVGATPRTHGRSPAVECEVAHNQLSGGCGQSSTSLSVGRDTEAPPELKEVRTPGRRRGHTHNGLSEADNLSEEEAATQDARCKTHGVGDVTGRERCDADGDIKLGAVPTLAALMELDEMSFDEFGEALQAVVLAEAVVIRPEEELNSFSLLDEAA
ncbi:unnamed protein product [Phytophthora fragariaefolia]|uniref:Unnamed protein product n=1 Tax=Phytophthora fragariaefolia TaxID=1490495 RepID=A0A9W6XZ32_9STRA|nr:unnamed protein product [Phytophthora fragariaefolia]